MGVINPPAPPQTTGSRRWLTLFGAAALWFVVGPALSRLLYEGLFPAWGWAGRPLPVILMGLGAAALGGWATWRARLPVAAFLPLLLNLVWLTDPAVALGRGRFLFGASLWAVAVLLVWARIGDDDRRWRGLGPLFVAVGLLPVYLLTMSAAVGAADTFEFQVVAPQLGIAHPTGYPLYLLLGKLFSLLPAGTVAFRLNLASAVYAVAAAAVLFRLALRLLGKPPAALAGAIALGLVPVYWSQAIVAEVYTLHALITAAALLLTLRLADSPPGDDPATIAAATAGSHKTMTALAFVLGLGLANHLTTVFLMPGAALAILFALRDGRRGERRAAAGRRRSLALLALQLVVAFALPLLLYAYLPLRWAAVNHEPMGLGRFVDWVIGGRFQGALQPMAWLNDPTRRAIVGRLFFDAWGWFYLILAGVGLAWLVARRRRAALLLAIAAAGFTFYALNYYVPDLAVFLIPAHVVIAVWVAAGAAALLDLPSVRRNGRSAALPAAVFTVVLAPALIGAGGRWATVDQSGRDGGEPWARAALARPLAEGAAVLADSEKIAPLYYLQQVEGLRPDLAIMVLPDEAAYRAELETRLAAGQAVYLARYLPGLEGRYHLRSEGALVEVSREPLAALPAGATASDLAFGPLRLAGYRLDPAAGDPSTDAPAADVPSATLYWTLDGPLPDGEPTPTLYTRWVGGALDGAVTIAAGQHPVANNYPVNAMRPGEFVPDYHALPVPDFACDDPAGCPLEFQVAAAPRFTTPDETAWQTVATIPVRPRSGPVGDARRAYFTGFALDGVDAAHLPLRYSGYGRADALAFLLLPSHAVSSFVFPAAGAPAPHDGAGGSAVFLADAAPDSAAPGEPLSLVALPAGEQRAVCGWLAGPTTGCVLAEVTAGVTVPEGAVNFDGQVALLDVAVDESALVPGGQLPVTLTWQGLADMSEDYTVFVQVLDAADRIVGQVDAWPVQGTFPTSQWRPGATVTDPYLVALSPEMQPGPHRLHVGLYLLATGQRLPVVDAEGNAVDDKVELGIGNW